MFDEQPDGDPHGECAAEIGRLRDANVKLAGALDMVRETLSGGNVQDLLFIINEALRVHREAAND